MSKKVRTKKPRSKKTKRVCAAEATLSCSAEAAIMLPEMGADNSPPETIQWMPPGFHDIVPFVDGKAQRVKINVTADLAQKFNTQLQTLRAAATRGEDDEPYLDFNHKDEERAADVTELYWGGDDPRTGGIRARVKWTAAGAAAIKGRSYRRFSPSWDLDAETFQPHHIKTNLGGLVTRAAFKKMAPVTAKDGGAATTTPENNMELKDIKSAVEEAMKPVNDRIEALEKKGSATAAAANAGDADTDKITKAVQAALKPIEDRMKATEDRTLKAQAKAAIQPHIERGAIAPQNTKLIETLEKMYAADPDGTVTVMAQLAGKRTGRIVTGPTAPTGTESAHTDQPEDQFMAKAREFGSKAGLKTDADCLTAFAKTAEGQELYGEFRRNYATVQAAQRN